MPIYEFRCKVCGEGVVKDHSHDAHPENGPLLLLESVRVGYTLLPAIHFKGSGFYNTDYKRKKEHGAKEDKPTPQETKEKADASKPTKPTHDP